MHSFFTLRKTYGFALVSLLMFSACTRISSTDIGGGLIPPIDGVTTVDTLLDVITDSYDDLDTARVYSSDMHVLGAITNDPLFGSTRASMFFEMQPDAYPFYITGHKDSIHVDSAVLILSIRSGYGDSTAPLRVTVSEIGSAAPFQFERPYPVNYPNAIPIAIGPALGTPVTVDLRRLSDSVKNRFENASNQLRIRLRDDVAARFLKTYDSATVYKSDSALRTVFNGFAVTADATGGANALVNVSLTDTNSKFALYYSTSATGATIRDTGVAYFHYKPSSSANANFVTRNRAGSEAAQHLTTTSKPDSLVYVQAGPGTYVRVRIPGLQGLSNRIIHRAELITEQVPDDAHPNIDKEMIPPRYLWLSVYDSVNNVKRNIPNDYVLDENGPNISTSGGYLTYKSVPGYDRVAAYTFDLSRYVQGIVTRKDTSYTLRLTAPVNDSVQYKPPYPVNIAPTGYYLTPTYGNDIANGRVRLGGGTHSRFRMRLRIIFSRI